MASPALPTANACRKQPLQVKCGLAEGLWRHVSDRTLPAIPNLPRPTE